MATLDIPHRLYALLNLRLSNNDVQYYPHLISPLSLKDGVNGLGEDKCFYYKKVHVLSYPDFLHLLIN